MQYLGFDPGGTTGWSLVEVTDNKLELILSGQTTDLNALLIDCDLSVDRIVYESFILRRGAFTSDQILPVYGIGAIELYAAQRNTPVSTVTPAQSKSAVSDDMLEQLGLSGPAGYENRHQRDATRTIVQVLLRERNKTLIERLRHAKA